MNIKRFLLAVVAVTVAFQAMDFVIHGLILSGTYQALKGVWRPNMDEFMWMMPVFGVLFSTVFVYFYVTWRRVGGAGEGIKYGVIVGLLVGIVGFNQFIVYPVPFGLTLKWFFFGLLEFAVVGLLAGILYQPPEY